jgi:ribosomal subunit interface protein
MMEKSLNMKVCCKQIKIDGRTEEYINKRIEKLDKFLKKITKLLYEVEIHMDKKGKFILELMVKTPYKLYRAEEMSESIEGCVDLAVEKVKNQIIRDRDKIKELKERGARSLKKKVVVDAGARFRK